MTGRSFFKESKKKEEERGKGKEEGGRNFLAEWKPLTGDGVVVATQEAKVEGEGDCGADRG